MSCHRRVRCSNHRPTGRCRRHRWPAAARRARPCPPQCLPTRRQEAARQEASRQEASRQEAARQEAARQGLRRRSVMTPRSSCRCRGGRAARAATAV